MITSLLARLRPLGENIARHPLWLLPLIIGLFFHKLTFTNLILARGDTFLYFYPYWEAAAAALRNGRFPLWNPHLFMGAPLLANAQVGFLYPLNWPLWLTLDVPTAVKVAILLHLFIAGWGAFRLARRWLGLEPLAGWLTAVLFALGGYLTAQVEHVNQLQGLAWLPWVLLNLHWLSHNVQRKQGWGVLWRGLWLALLFALQFLAGHTQTLFITLVAAAIFQLTAFGVWLRERDKLPVWTTRQKLRALVQTTLALGAAGLFALALAAAQLLPTLELTSLSSRQGGLTVNEVLSFSMHPLLLGRGLLPSVGQSLFTEYVAVLPISALLLVLMAAWQWRRWPQLLPAILLVVVGLFLALGQFNPANWLLARLPGFNLFRVPARWLVLYALGASLLAGAGWQMLQDKWRQGTEKWGELPESTQQRLWHLERPFTLAVYLIVALIFWDALGNLLVRFIPTGPEAPFESVSRRGILLQVGELLFAFGWVTGRLPTLARNANGRLRLQLRRVRPQAPVVLLGVSLLVLFIATRTHPYNEPTTPAAYASLRAPITRLQANAPECRTPLAHCAAPPDRMLSLSPIFFDPGDAAELQTIYGDALSEQAWQDYLVAIKQKEIIAPNLPLTFGLASVDGFDGGILPLASYSQLVSVLLPDGQFTTDGRLRENLTAVPDERWLDLLNVRYLITDKTADPFPRGVYMDRFHSVPLDQSVSVGHLPDYEATALWLLADGDPGVVIVHADGQTFGLEAVLLEEGLYEVLFPRPLVAEEILLGGAIEVGKGENCQLLIVNCQLLIRGGSTKSKIVNRQSSIVHALTLVDERDGSFQPLVLGDYRLVYSGDVKIHENLDVLPRALMLFDWETAENETAVLDRLRQPDFDPRKTAVLLNNVGAQRAVPTQPPNSEYQIQITQYTPTQIHLTLTTSHDGLLLLTDANYPGWQATLNGNSVAVETVNLLFRGLFVPAGEHEVRLDFKAAAVENGRFISLTALLLWLSLLLATTIAVRRHLFG